MKSESNLVLEVWELMREQVPQARRGEISISLLRCFEEYGFESSDMADILDEDEHLTSAYRAIFGGGDSEEEDEVDMYGDEPFDE